MEGEEAKQPSSRIVEWWNFGRGGLGVSAWDWRSGTIVKARDKLYHPECFMCDDCGLNLKQRGYFFIEEQLYCETHAKERVKPPEGYDVVAVYPNAKVELV